MLRPITVLETNVSFHHKTGRYLSQINRRCCAHKFILEIEMKALALTLLMLLTLTTGCATNRTLDADIKQHCAMLYANSQIDPVRGKILLPITYGAGQPIEILADGTTPTDPERQALLAVSRAFQDCNEYAAQQLGPMPAYRSVSNDRVTEALSQLYAGRLTFGDFAHEMLHIGERDQLASEELSKALRAPQQWGQLSDE
jgi:hypothetical protein